MSSKAPHESTFPDPLPPSETRHTAETEKPDEVEPSQAETGSAFRGSILPGDIWCLIFDLVYHDGTKRDLFNLCLVSKAIRALASPYLYRSVYISPVDCAGITWLRRNAFPLLERPSRLVHRLLGSQSLDAGCLVRELRVEARFDVEGQTALKATKIAVSNFIGQDCLAQLVNRLPNLERIQTEFPLPLTDKLADNLDNHCNKIDIQVVWMHTYDRSISRRLLPSISAISARVWCSGVSDELHSFLLSCNNLRSFSLQRMSRSMILSERLRSPSRVIYLSGGFNSWPLWKDQSPWSSLLSLSIDSNLMDSIDLLGVMPGQTPFLEKLRIAFDVEEHSVKFVEQFVSSFQTLKSFVCIGWCSLRALSSHAHLIDLKIHADSLTSCSYEWQETSKLNTGDLEQLSVDCPELRWLELDAQLVDRELPWDVIITLATKFDRLHSLTLHFDMRLKAPLKSAQTILDSSDVKKIGDVFYSHRWRDSNGSSSLNGFQRLVVDVRCQSMLEGLEEEQSLFKGTFEMRAPTDPAQSSQVVILESDLQTDFEQVLRQRIGGFFA